MKSFSVSRSYDVAPGRLVELLLDPAFVTERASRFGGAGEPTVQRSSAGAVLTIPRALPMDKVPSAARGFLPAGGRLTQKEAWDLDDTGARASWSVDAGPGATVAGTQRVEADRSGSRHLIEGSVTIPIPFLGGKLETMVVEHLQQLLAHEQAFAAERLGG